MNTEHTYIGWRFGLRWVLLTVAGWIIGFPLGFILVPVTGWIIGVHDDSILLKLGLDNAALFIIVVAVVGLMQWLALRRIFRRAGFWVLANIIGFTISSISHGVVCHIYGYSDDLGPLGTLVWVAAFVVGGILTGVLQQRILRRQIRNSGWWVPANAAGWGLGIAGFDMLGLGIAYKISTPLLAFSVLVGLVLHGIVTGAVLIWLLQHPISQTADA